MSTATETAPDQKLYAPPLLRVGDRIEISQDSTWTRPAFGFVTKVEGRYADVSMLAGRRTVTFYSCLYYDDPFVTERPHLLNDEDRAVIRLTAPEVSLRAMEDELAALRQLCESLSGRLEAAEEGSIFEVPAPEVPKGDAPTKPCPECDAQMHVRKRKCDCGHRFPAKGE